MAKARPKLTPAEFRSRLLIDAPGGPRRLSDVLDPWQRTDFEAIDPAWEAMVVQQAVPIKCGYMERPRGHSKTSDMAVSAAWALWASPRTVSGVAGAGSQQQAKLLRNGIERLARLNPWLGLSVQNYRVVNKRTGSELEILTSEAGTNFGHTPDFIIVDEITNWEHVTDEKFWEALISAAAKKAHCLVVVIANAGFGRGTSWQWRIREHCRTSPRWYFSTLDGPQASWLTQEALEEQRRILPPKGYLRLWGNKWVTEVGDGLPMDVVESCCTAPGPLMSYDQSWAPFIGAIDLGLKKDHAAFAVVGMNLRTKRFRLAHLQAWDPADFGGEIKLPVVFREILEVCKRLQVLGVAYDPWQAVMMAQMLAEERVKVFSYEFTPQHLDVMATTMLRMFTERTLELYRDESLLRDLARLTIIERPIGFKLHSTRDEHGHADRATALAIALPWAAGTCTDYLNN